MLTSIRLLMHYNTNTSNLLWSLHILFIIANNCECLYYDAALTRFDKMQDAAGV